MKTINDVLSVDWAVKLGSIGEMVEDFDDINQCISIILNTRKGAVPLNPLFGSDIWKYLDKPANIAIPGIILEATEAINLWERRVKVEEIQVLELLGGYARLRIVYSSVYTGNIRVFEVVI